MLPTLLFVIYYLKRELSTKLMRKVNCCKYVLIILQLPLSKKKLYVETGVKTMRNAPTYEQFHSMKHFGALDGMRAIGVIMVIFEHCGGEKFKFLSGWLGVHIFFVMSGFLITTLLLREQDKNGSVSLRDFYIRRVFRIVPVYYLILTITIAQSYILSGETWEQMKHAWFYFVMFLGEQKFVAPWKITWTMGIEWKFYLLWPFLAFLFPLGSKRIGLAISTIILILSLLWNNSIIQAPHYIILLLGALVAILLHYRSTFNIIRFIMNPFASFILAICVAVMQLYMINIPSISGGYGGAKGILLYGIIVSLFLPTLIGSNMINSILKSSAFSFVGKRSYSLYLIQILAWQSVFGMTIVKESATKAILTVLVGLIFSDCLYRWVEIPMISVGKWFAHKFSRSQSSNH